ncbi:chemotaxis protein CheB [Aquabacter sp. L1I39]|uniref:chemotaxis protein CheB n=1 Tax=Aquabacter sp. L1I39 TaxID=2820278 RepID=UPI001ADC7D96|nr:chemotaxis protein CheB [Aquabacter sp. L1I39]QTL02232.1 chemotaxis protein CheB [Aquabacter sp. L1I39]
MQAVVVGSSAGGPAALHDLLSRLSPDFPAPVVIVSHVGRGGGALLASGLALHSALPVRPAAERAPLQAGHVYVAPDDYHLLMESHGRLALSVDERVCFSRPCIDVLFASAARVYRHELVGIVLSGANGDGAEGLRQIRRNGGTALIQDPSEAVVGAMPRMAQDRAGSDLCAPVADLAAYLNGFVER